MSQTSVNKPNLINSWKEQWKWLLGPVGTVRYSLKSGGNKNQEKDDNIHAQTPGWVPDIVGTTYAKQPRNSKGFYTYREI